MATDYFACGAFGILLEGEDEKQLNDLRDKALEIILENDEDDDLDIKTIELFAISEDISKAYCDIRDALIEKYDAPPDVNAVWTGDADDRPGRCHAPPYSWVLGYGLPAVPKKCGVLANAVDFCRMADWYTWVEAG